MLGYINNAVVLFLNLVAHILFCAILEKWLGSFRSAFLSGDDQEEPKNEHFTYYPLSTWWYCAFYATEG